jgi:ubiquitin thioesterase protein OTUB1
MVAFMRSCCGAYIRKFSEEMLPFVPAEYATIDSFIRNEVDPMFKDCDQIQIVALTRALGVPLKIVYLDQSPGPAAIHSFGPEGSGVTLLYKPGHYDLLY